MIILAITHTVLDIRYVNSLYNDLILRTHILNDNCIYIYMCMWVWVSVCVPWYLF